MPRTSLALVIFGILVALSGSAVLIPSIWTRPCSDIYCPAYPLEPNLTIGLVLVAAGIVSIILGAVVRIRSPRLARTGAP